MCVGALFMVNAADSYNHPLSMIAKDHFHDFHRVHKRQSDDSNDHCVDEFTEELCTSGFEQDILDLAVRCNQPTAPIINYCSRNSNGRLCGAINTDALREETERIGCDFSSTTCRPECRAMLMSIRDELGCCFSFYNDSTSGSYDPTLFDSRLWTSCGVRGSNQACSLSTVELQQLPRDPTCTQYEYQDQVFYTVNCRREYILPLMARVSAVEGCEDYVTEGSYVSCNTNRFGVHCDDLIYETGANFTAANEACNDTSTCDPLCIETLNNISDTSGCCFNEDYNDTFTRNIPDWFTAEYYSMCGLESPGLCGLGISIPDDDDSIPDDALSITASSIPIAIAAILLLLINVLL